MKLPQGSTKVIAAVVGTGLLWYLEGFLVVLAILIMIWANNMFMMANHEVKLNILFSSWLEQQRLQKKYGNKSDRAI